MSVVDLTGDQSPLCPEASNSRESSPVREMYGPEENESWQMSPAETLHTDTVSPLPSSMDLLIQNSPDSSTSPSVILPTAVDSSTGKKEEKAQVKKQKIRTVFSQTQLCVLNERFQRQKYLSLQQMQELSKILNLSYKQIKTWFQNQRMKCKRWQKYNWPKNSNCTTRKGSATATGAAAAAAAEYPGLPSCHQGCLVNASGSLSMWSNQPCNNPAWSNHSWNSQSWSYHAWNSQTWYPQAWNNQTWNNNQAWNNQFYSCGEEALQIQFPQNRPVSDWEAAWETAGESYDVVQQTSPKYCSTQQTMDFFPNYSMNIESEDV